MSLLCEGSYKCEGKFFDGFTLSILSPFASHEKTESEIWRIKNAGQRSPHKISVPIFSSCCGTTLFVVAIFHLPTVQDESKWI